MSSESAAEPQVSDAALLDGIVGRDPTALAALYDRYAGLLSSVLTRILRDTQGAEEILQDVFFQLWSAPSRFDPALGSLPGWLMVVARNRAISQLRRRNPAAGDDDQVAALRVTAHQQQERLEEGRNLDEMMESPDTVTVALAQPPGMPQGSAHVMYKAKMGLLVYDGELASAPAAKSYQLWLVPAAGKPISADVFNPVSGRADHWRITLGRGLKPKMFAVTIEPSGGVPQPTGPMVLIGRA